MTRRTSTSYVVYSLFISYRSFFSLLFVRESNLCISSPGAKAHKAKSARGLRFKLQLLCPVNPGGFERTLARVYRGTADVLHPESKQQTTPAAPRDALECVAALARTREIRQNCVRFAYRGPQVDRFHVLELKRDVE